MTLFNHDIELPTDEVPSFVQGEQITTPLIIIVATAIIYDTGTRLMAIVLLIFRLNIFFIAITMDKEVSKRSLWTD